MKVNTTRFVGLLLMFLFLLGWAQLFEPMTEGQQGTLVVDRSYWLRLANNAWKYFQPGVGVDSTTGLHSASLGYPYFTDWDLGVYIQAIIDANKLGILGTSGLWGADARFTYILAFLQTRQLSSNGVPFVWYQSADGNPDGNDQQCAADSGELFVALNNLRVFRPALAGAINNIVYNRTNYTPLEQAVDALSSSKNLYDYYVASGFAGFWPSRFSTLATSILNNIMSAPTVSTYGAKLPISKLTCEPLFLSIFNLPSNVKLSAIADQVYLAHEAKYKATGKFVAFSEGNTGLSNPSYVYEWVVKEDGSTWTIDDGQVNVGISPIVYFKSAVGLLAMHNTLFTENMASYIESRLPNPSNGYSDGIDENGRVGSSKVDKTNGLIIGAALYAITNPQNNNSSPTPTSGPGSPTSSPTVTPGTSSSSVSPTPNTSTGLSPSPSSSTASTPGPDSPSSSSPTGTPGPSSSSASPTLSPLTSPSPNSSPASSIAPTSESGNPSCSPFVPSFNAPLTSWYVILFIAVLLVIGYASVVQNRRRNSPKTLNI